MYSKLFNLFERVGYFRHPALVNGREFVFVKLTQQETPQYSLSKAFSILTPEQDLYDVLHLLKYIGGLISQ